MKLKFKFVDRYDERNILKKYFSNNNIREQGVWISGPHNIGKTELVKETINYLKNKKIIDEDTYEKSRVQIEKIAQS